jgi:hypothetical protein
MLNYRLRQSTPFHAKSKALHLIFRTKTEKLRMTTRMSFRGAPRGRGTGANFGGGGGRSGGGFGARGGERINYKALYELS